MRWLGGNVKTKMPVEQKNSQCAQQASALGEAMEVLEKLVAVLGEKLLPVRSPRLACKAESCDKAPEPSIAPLAQYLKDRAAQGKRIADQLKGLLDEVEC